MTLIVVPQHAYCLRSPVLNELRSLNIDLVIVYSVKPDEILRS